MAERAPRKKAVAALLVLLPIIFFAWHSFGAAPKQYTGVDEAVVEKVAREHGREARRPLIDPGEGDILLFAFLVAGAVGGFAAGYYWRDLTRK